MRILTTTKTFFALFSLLLAIEQVVATAAAPKPTNHSGNTTTTTGDTTSKNQRHHRHRRVLSSSSPDYYDSMRSVWGSPPTDALHPQYQVSTEENSGIYQVQWNTTTGTDSTGTAHNNNNSNNAFRLAEIKAFLRFATNDKVVPALRNEAFAVLLAMRHFNSQTASTTGIRSATGSTPHPVLRGSSNNNSSSGSLAEYPDFLAKCNVKLTLELFDGQHNARRSTQLFSQAIRQTTTTNGDTSSSTTSPTSLTNPPIAAVIGGTYSSETMPLAIYTGTYNIPHLSASATSNVFDDKELYPLFGRTNTNTIGEAAVAARFFELIGSTHVAVIFGTVRMSNKSNNNCVNYFVFGFTVETRRFSC